MSSSESEPMVVHEGESGSWVAEQGDLAHHHTEEVKEKKVNMTEEATTDTNEGRKVSEQGGANSSQPSETKEEPHRPSD